MDKGTLCSNAIPFQTGLKPRPVGPVRGFRDHLRDSKPTDTRPTRLFVSFPVQFHLQFTLMRQKSTSSWYRRDSQGIYRKLRCFTGKALASHVTDERHQKVDLRNVRFRLENPVQAITGRDGLADTFGRAKLLVSALDFLVQKLSSLAGHSSPDINSFPHKISSILVPLSSSLASSIFRQSCQSLPIINLNYIVNPMLTL